MTNQRVLFRAEGLPLLQNKTFSSQADALACVTADVVLVQDPRTGLIFNSNFDPARVIYDSSYQNEQAHSLAYKTHLTHIESIIARQFAACSLVEIGCGKGHFLERLKMAGYSVTGVDPAYEGTDPTVVRELFTAQLDLAADGVILRHVLEHVSDPMAFIADIAHTNGGAGRVYLEVPCFDWICQNRAWFDIFYEHVNYFRLSDFYRMFGNVMEAGYLFGGQYIYVVAELASLRRPHIARGDLVDFPTDFMSSVQDHGRRARGNPVGINALWGGASKGVIFAIHMARTGAPIDIAIDINPEKQGGYLPVTGLRVHSVSEAVQILPAGANVFVMNSNYLDEIISQSQARFTYLAADGNQP